MLGPGCWSIRVACSPGANCLEDLIQWPLPSFPLLWCQPRSLTSTLHPLAMGGGHSRSPISVLMTLQSPIIKHIDWTFSTLSRKEALEFPGSPRISEQSPINYLLIPQSSLDLSEFNMDSQFTPFTMKSKPLGIRCLKRKADLAFLQREGVGWGAPPPRTRSPVLQLPGSWSWPRNDCSGWNEQRARWCPSHNSRQKHVSFWMAPGICGIC